MSPRCLAPERPALLRFHGPDARRFLNGQLTQDVAALGDHCRDSCVTDARGRLQHFVEVLDGPGEDELWVVASGQDADALHARLTRYLIADEVEVEDLSGTWTRIHAGGGLEAPLRRRRTGVFGAGIDHWWPAGGEPALEPVDSAVAESLRIRRGQPAWGRELVEGLLPPEAGLDRSAISFAKGCYIGQEVISRIKSAGKLNRRLALLEVPADARAGDALSLDGREAGQLTSVTPDLPRQALAFLHKSAFEAEGLMLARAGDEKGPAKRLGWSGSLPEP